MILISACRTTPDTIMSRPKQPIQDCRTVQHVMGNTCIPRNPQRVVTFTTTVLGNTLALGVKPIATTNDYLLPKKGELPPYLNPKSQGIKILGNSGQPNIERLLNLQPDLILGWGGYNFQAIYPILSKIAPTVLYSPGEKTWKEDFDFTAKVLGKQDNAQVAWQHYQKRIQLLRDALKNRYKDKTISFAYFYYGRTETAAINSFPGSIFSDIGLKRPEYQNVITSDGWGIKAFSEEELENIDGDILFVATLKDDDKKSLEKLKNKPLWNKLKAVQNNQVYFVSGFTWLTGNDMIAANAVIDDLFQYLVDSNS